MPTTFASVTEQARALLGDSGALIYSSAALTAGTRLALADYALAMGQACALEGLDGAPATTLPELHAGLIVLGAAGYALCSRRAGAVSTLSTDWGAREGAPGEGLRDLASELLAAFQRRLIRAAEQARKSGLFTAAAPWGPWAEEDP